MHQVRRSSDCCRTHTGKWSVDHTSGIMIVNTYQSAKVVPDFGDVRVETDCSGVCIQCITILIDLIVQHTDGAPERWIPPISIHGLLISFICLWKLGLSHIATTEKVPALGILIVCSRCQLKVIAYKQICLLPELTDFSKYSMA